MVLGEVFGKRTELEAAVAVELSGHSCAPLHDHRGNVCCLINSASGIISEFYRYSAFGEEQVYSGDAQTLTQSSLNNPWLYASKRLDPHTRLIQFGKRDYDSNLGRWISPDPLGFADGPNLYAYVQNNPLTFFDPYGLFSQSNAWDSGMSAGTGAWNGAMHPIDTGSRFLKLWRDAW